MAVLTLEQILAANDVKPTMVAIPEWGGDVAVYPLTSKELDEWETWLTDNPYGDLRLKLLSLSLKDYTADEIKLLAGKNGAVIKHLVEVAASLINERQKPADLGNSDAGQDAGNGSD